MFILVTIIIGNQYPKRFIEWRWVLEGWYINGLKK